MNSDRSRRVLLLCGGVGGARLAHGFELLADAVETWVLVNVGDDFEHLGLSISPDLDTVLYTLGGIANREQGWGIEGESWRTLERLEALGGESWFRLGDLDLATHLYRSAALARGESLTGISEHLAQRLGIRSRILPATDQRLRTRVQTEQGELDFQTYFVRERCAPKVRSISYAGAELARPSPVIEGIAATDGPHFDALVIAPSNPFLSIAPILAVPGMTALLQHVAKRTVAVSPIVAGAAIKGPAAKLMGEHGLSVSAAGWARYLRDSYGQLVDEWILDSADSEGARELDDAGFRVRTMNTIMSTTDRRRELAEQLVAGYC